MKMLGKRCLAAMALSLTQACFAVTQGKPEPPPIALDPAAACQAVSATYIGDMKCRTRTGNTLQLMSGADAAAARQSEMRVADGSPRAWALATTAITFQYNRYAHDTLAGMQSTPDTRAAEKKSLAEWWGIASRSQLLDTLNWLQFTGHRAEFEQLGKQLDERRGVDHVPHTAEIRNSPDRLNKLKLVRHHYHELGDKSILAWDLIRFISLCRWGYLVGYLSEDEAWAYMMPAAARLQQTYASWKDVQDDFLIGRRFWSLKQTHDTGKQYQAIEARLLQDPHSPWKLNPWRMDLQVANPMPIMGPGFTSR